MSKQTEIAASDWLAVRERVVDKLREASPRTEKGTRVRMAEELILAGFVDVEFIAAEIAAESAEAERVKRMNEAQRADAQKTRIALGEKAEAN